MHANQQHQNVDGRKSSTMKDWVFITVNPQPAVTVKELVNSVKQFFDTKTIDKGVYVFEQRATDENFHGWHTHMLFHRIAKPSVISKRIATSFNALVNDPSNSHYIKIISHDTHEQFANLLPYIQGKKANADKMAKAINDADFRTHYGLQSHYTVGDYILVKSPNSTNKINLKIKRI